MTVPFKDLFQEEVVKVLTPLGSTRAQIGDACEMLPSRDLVMDKGTVFIKEAGVALDSEGARAWLQTNKPHYLFAARQRCG